MRHGYPESDWKAFRALREKVLERFCKRILAELDSLRTDGSRTHHERYLDIWGLMRKRDNDIADAFNNPKRSQMINQLIAMHKHDLLEQTELDNFSPDTRDKVEKVVRAMKGHK
jgi:hypothetical protein